MPCVQTQIYLFLCSKFLRGFLLVCVLIVSLPMNVCSSQLGVCVIHWLATQLVFLRCEFCFLLVLQATPRSHYGIVRFNFPPLFLSYSFAYLGISIFCREYCFVCKLNSDNCLLASTTCLVPGLHGRRETFLSSHAAWVQGALQKGWWVCFGEQCYFSKIHPPHTLQCSCIHAGILQGLFCDVLPYIRNNRKWCLPSLCLFLLTCLNTTASYIAQPVLPCS